MIPLGTNRQGETALRKQIHDIFVRNAPRGFRVGELAQMLGTDPKRVSSAIVNMTTNQKVALNYPHIHRIDHGVYAYDSQRPQVFTKRAKKIQPTKQTASQPMAQPMSIDYTEVKDAIVLRHRTGKLYIARPIN